MKTTKKNKENAVLVMMREKETATKTNRNRKINVQANY